MLSFSSSNSAAQSFTLPRELIYNAIKNSDNKLSPELYFKLYKTCKYFFTTMKIIPISRLYHGHKNAHFYYKSKGNMIITEYKAKRPLTDVKNLDFQLYLFDTLLFRGQSTFPEMLSALTSKIYRSDVSNLGLNDQKITFDEYKFLFPNLQRVVMHRVAICRSKEFLPCEVIPVEEILKATPNLFTFKFSPMKGYEGTYTPETSKKLVELDHNKRFKSFEIFNVPETFDATDFVNFVKKNITSEGQESPTGYSFLPCFAPTVPIVYRENFWKIIKEAVDAWEPKDYQPVIQYIQR